jgi:Lrp/AsnC family leucine-responsive transcriptional regulator
MPQSQLDRTDVRMLDHLQRDARISVVQLAQRVSLTPTPCARRLQKLEREGLIAGYVTLLDQARAGLPVNAFVEVKLVRERKDEAKLFEERIHNLPEVMECYAMSGGYDYLLRVVSADLEQYNRFLRDQLLEIASVDTVQTSFALERLIYRTSLPLTQLER